MELSKSNYRKFLIDEVIRYSNTSVSQAYIEVTKFSKEKEFEESYKKWVQLKQKNKLRGPKSLNEIFNGMLL